MNEMRTIMNDYHRQDDRNPGEEPSAVASLTVSAIVPLYNGALCIGSALDSIAAQTRLPIEIIVVDDGSVDRGMSVVAEWARSTSLLVRCLSQTNAGPGAARNTAIAQAQGNVFAFLDQDDIWHPGKLARQVLQLESDPQLDVVLAHMDTRLAAGQTLPDWMRERQLGHQPGWLPGTLVARRRAFERIGLFDDSFRVGSDFAWFGRMRDAGLHWRMLDDVLLTHIIHGGNQSSDRRVKSDLLRAVRESIERKRGMA